MTEISYANLLSHKQKLEAELSLINELQFEKSSAFEEPTNLDYSIFDPHNKKFFAFECYDLEKGTVILLRSSYNPDHLSDPLNCEEKFDSCFVEFTFDEYRENILPLIGRFKDEAFDFIQSMETIIKNNFEGMLEYE